MYFSFKQFSELLFEKVSKSDLNAALNDPTFRIGCEFEYIDDNLANFEGGESMDDVREEYEELVSSIEFVISNHFLAKL